MNTQKYRYYCLNRPPMPGTVPRGMTNIVSMDDKPFVPEINRAAWGYVEYDYPLPEKAIRDYELMASTGETHDEGCNEDFCSIKKHRNKA